MNLSSSLTRWLFVALLSSFAVPAWAEPLIFVPSDDLAIGMLQNRMARNLLKAKKPPQASALRQSASLSTVLTEIAPARTPAKLAQTYPSDQQAAAEKAYQSVLLGFHDIESRLGIPRNDVAGAVAAFVAGSWMAYRDTHLPDSHFQALVLQMRQIIGSQPQFQGATPQEKQELYEQMAILGTTMALTREGLKRQPDRSTQLRLRETAGKYLEQFLGTDADRVSITSAGLRFE